MVHIQWLLLPVNRISTLLRVTNWGKLTYLKVFKLVNFMPKYIVLEILAPSSRMWYRTPVTIINYWPWRKGKSCFASHECRFRESPGMEGIICPLGHCWVACAEEESLEAEKVLVITCSNGCTTGPSWPCLPIQQLYQKLLEIFPALYCVCVTSPTPLHDVTVCFQFLW